MVIPGWSRDLGESSPAAAASRPHRARLPGSGRPGDVRPANLAQQTPPPGQAAGETRANRRARTGQPPPPAAARSAGLSWARWLGGDEGGGAGEGGGARAAPLKRAAAGAGAAQPRSEPETGRACVCLCFARARSSASRGVAAKVCSAFGSSTGPWPCRLRAPLLPHSQRRGPNWQLLSPLFARGPGGRTWVRVQTGPCHFQKKEKTGRRTGSSAGVRKRSSRARTATLGFCVVYFLTDVVPSTLFPVKDKGREQVGT